MVLYYQNNFDSREHMFARNLMIIKPKIFKNYVFLTNLKDHQTHFKTYFNKEC